MGIPERPAPEHRCAFCERELPHDILRNGRRWKYCANRGRCRQAAYRRRKRLASKRWPDANAI